MSEADWEQLLVEARESGPSALQDVDLREAQLGGLDLSALDLSGRDLSGSNLAHARLVNAQLAGSKLRDANLLGADLTGASLVGADLGGANLDNCAAERASFGGAELGRARLFEARLEGAVFSRARLVSADLRCTNLRSARLHEVDLSGADLTQSDLSLAELDGSDVARAHFDRALMRSARLSGLRHGEEASWIGVDMRDADFRGAHRLRRQIIDENYLHELRSDGPVGRALYWIWWVSSDCGRSLGRWSFWTGMLALVFAGLYLLVDVDWGEHRTALSPIYFSIVTLTTLGYGDVLPASATAQALVMLEVVLGYMALGGLISILANKMARRGE